MASRRSCERCGAFLKGDLKDCERCYEWERRDFVADVYDWPGPSKEPARWVHADGTVIYRDDA